MARTGLRLGSDILVNNIIEYFNIKLIFSRLASDLVFSWRSLGITNKGVNVSSLKQNYKNLVFL